MTRKFIIFGIELLITPVSEVAKQNETFDQYRERKKKEGPHHGRDGKFSKHPFWGSYPEIVMASKRGLKNANSY